MSCKKEQCCNHKRAEMLDSATILNLGAQGAEVLGNLFAVAKTGAVDMLKFRDSTLVALAFEIQQLWEQAQIAKLINTPEIAVDKQITDVSIKFGPAKQYNLTIPVTGPVSKKELADSLRDVAAKLDPPVVDNQLPLPFDA